MTRLVVIGQGYVGLPMSLLAAANGMSVTGLDTHRGPPGAWSTTDPKLPPPGSIAHAYRAQFGSEVVKTQNDRLGGWQLLDQHLKVRADGLPRLLVHSTCTNLIRTLPAVPHDRGNPEDVDTKSEDHAIDALRYLLQQLAGQVQPPAAGGQGAILVRAESGGLASAAF